MSADFTGYAGLKPETSSPTAARVLDRSDVRTLWIKAGYDPKAEPLDNGLAGVLFPGGVREKRLDPDRTWVPKKYGHTCDGWRAGIGIVGLYTSQATMIETNWGMEEVRSRGPQWYDNSGKHVSCTPTPEREKRSLTAARDRAGSARDAKDAEAEEKAC